MMILGSCLVDRKTGAGRAIYTRHGILCKGAARKATVRHNSTCCDAELRDGTFAILGEYPHRPHIGSVATVWRQRDHIDTEKNGPKGFKIWILPPWFT